MTRSRPSSAGRSTTRSAAWPARSVRTAASPSTMPRSTHLVGLAGGDARSALNVLEGAAALAEAEDIRDADGHVTPRLEDVEAAAQQRVLAYDRAGDGHYDTASAFIKSLRGNDPDGALYWLAAMIAAGEDPRFIARRLIIAPRRTSATPTRAPCRSRSRRPRRSTTSACPRPSTRSPRRRPTSRPRRSRTGPGSAFCAAVGDVEAHGSLPVPLHLRNAAHRADEAARDRRRLSLPARLRGRRRRLSSTCPTSSPSAATTCRPTTGTRRRSANRMAARAEARAAGKPRRDANPTPTGMGGADLMRTRETNRKKLAETEKRDAAGE